MPIPRRPIATVTASLDAMASLERLAESTDLGRSTAPWSTRWRAWRR